jgi:hypothetical protein
LRQKTEKRVRNQLLLDLFAEDSWRTVYAAEHEARPPAAPTTGPEGTRCKMSVPGLVLNDLTENAHRVQPESVEAAVPFGEYEVFVTARDHLGKLN